MIQMILKRKVWYGVQIYEGKFISTKGSPYPLVDLDQGSKCVGWSKSTVTPAFIAFLLSCFCNL